MTVSIQKFSIIVLVSNGIEYWSNYSIQLQILNIRTALLESGLNLENQKPTPSDGL